ncbi:GNAT family N-acetyltransferase [Hyphomonas sp. NPDC076900]|uniref:GNAT family N-acetyltransferase n=1 Tax=Hyphomonas sp. NPDC076900 TaxID=3390570 RepID=UPI003D05F078
MKGKELVDAELWDVISDKNLADWEAKWTPELIRLLGALYDKGVDRQLWPQSRHWDWRAKTVAIESRLDRQCFSIVCEGMTQAMMITDLTKRARLPDQKNDHLVYIDFVEAAPWNRREILGELPKFSGAGSILIRAAIEYSKVEGFKGRIGLHSLPQANDFYANRVRMTDLGQDSNYQNLRYFEMTPEQAEAFIREGK